MGLGSSLVHKWNLFASRKTSTYSHWDVNTSYTRPDRFALSYSTDRTIVSSIYNRISVDGAAVSMHHARLDENGNFSEVIKSKLDERLNLNANKDQTGREFIRDTIFSLCDEGVVAIVPTHTDTDPDLTQAFTIDSMRVCKIIEWHPDSIVCKIYNEDTGDYSEQIVPKHMAAIIENPFYEIMNCPNSSLQRLISKLNILDKLDNESVSGRLDLVIKLPYSIRNDLKREQAVQRRKDIEMQLVGSKYGIAYIDSSEEVTQLNRPANNLLLEQIKELTATVYNQLGLSEAIMNGTAGEQEMINYYNATIEPFLSAIANALKWKFISPTARTQGQSIYFYRDPFRLIPADKLAELSDKLTRNEIMSPNEIRGVIGLKPSSDPKANELRNRNINQNSDADSQKVDENQNEVDKEKIKEPPRKEDLNVSNRRTKSQTLGKDS